MAMAAQDLNRDLIGVAGGRWQLQTPALVIDLDMLERNIARMAEHARTVNIALRPHAKTHKCSEIARRQLEAGARGICVAKLGEAEALADAGIDSILITSPVVTDRGIARLTALNAQVRNLMAVCDNPEVAAKLAAAVVSGRNQGSNAVAVQLPAEPATGPASDCAANAAVQHERR